MSRILDGLPPEDACYLATQLEPAWKARARRLEARDTAIRAALPLAGEALGRQSLHACASELQALLRRPPTDASPLGVLVRRILELNGGEPIKWRQIVRAGAGGVQSSARFCHKQP